MREEAFDRRLAEECARAFSLSTGLGCTLSDKSGGVFADFGYSCEKCRLCEATGGARIDCVRAHIYGMTEAERFGGKYIYFCPMGLTCFVSPILSEYGAEAKITVGPFIMVERQDFIDCELVENARLTGETLEAAVRAVENVPLAPPERVNQLSTLLFMAVGFLNNVSAENRLLQNRRSDAIQGQITAYIQSLKREGDSRNYPFDLERRFLLSIERREREEAQRLLNELLGAILFTGGSDFERMKLRVYDLLVLISRTAIQSGADPHRTLRLNEESSRVLTDFHSIDSLCLWLSGALAGYMDELFTYADAKHADVIHRCIQYLGEHYAEPITLREAAEHVYLTPPYLCRVFKRETGVTFNEYLNRLRVSKAKELLRSPELRLTDVAQLVGYGDQSYFTKVFKRVTGLLPSAYRQKNLSPQPGGKNEPAKAARGAREGR